MGKVSVGEQALADAWEAARQGQAWALRVVYEGLAPQVAGYLRSRGAMDVEDLTSEVFLTVFTKLATITGGTAGLRTFTFSVAHARLVDSHRRASRQLPSVEYDPQLDARSTAGAEEYALAAEGVDRVTRLLAMLPPDQRDVLAMRVIGDLTVEQIAQVVKRSPGAVKQLQRRALVALRGHLAQDVPL
jgi:RNA polymerase sigma-70 factor (ECF subfamily)